MISCALFKTHNVVHYALIFTFLYSRKRFYHYTECIRPNTPASGDFAPRYLPAGALSLQPRWGHSLRGFADKVRHGTLARSFGSATIVS